MIKLLYKPVSVLVTVLGGVVAGAIFKRVWKLAAGEEEAPKATDIRRGYREVLLAAALQGAIFALVKAILERSAAEGTRKLTAFWPGKATSRTGRKGMPDHGWPAQKPKRGRSGQPGQGDGDDPAAVPGRRRPGDTA